MSITREQLSDLLRSSDRAASVQKELESKDRSGLTVDQRLDLDIATRQAFLRTFEAYQAYTAALDQFVQQAA
jgi:hypothetical protein